jgi:hypothetical protein
VTGLSASCTTTRTIHQCGVKSSKHSLTLQTITSLGAVVFKVPKRILLSMKDFQMQVCLILGYHIDSAFTVHSDNVDHLALFD